MDLHFSIVINSVWEQTAANHASHLNGVLRVGLGLVTLVSGVGKLLDPAGSRQAMSDFGVPSKYVVSATKALPIVELILSATIILDATSRLSSLALAWLFACFSLGIANLLRQDKAPPCNCFGAVHSDEVSKWTLLRSVLLAALAFLVHRLPTYALTPGFKSTVLAATLFGAVSYAVVLGVKRQRRLMLSKPAKRLAKGQRVPATRLWDGRWLEDLLAKDRPTLLLLTSTDCGHCTLLKQWINPWRGRVQESLHIVELQTLDSKQFADPPQIEGLGRFVFYFSPKEAGRFKSVTPGAFLVDETGTLLATPVAGRLEIEALVRLTLRQTAVATLGSE